MGTKQRILAVVLLMFISFLAVQTQLVWPSVLREAHTARFLTLLPAVSVGGHVHRAEGGASQNSTLPLLGTTNWRTKTSEPTVEHTPSPSPSRRLTPAQQKKREQREARRKIDEELAKQRSSILKEHARIASGAPHDGPGFRFYSTLQDFAQLMRSTSPACMKALEILMTIRCPTLLAEEYVKIAAQQNSSAVQLLALCGIGAQAPVPPICGDSLQRRLTKLLLLTHQLTRRRGPAGRVHKVQPLPLCFALILHQGILTQNNTLSSYRKAHLFGHAAQTVALLNEAQQRQKWVEFLRKRYPEITFFPEQQNTAFEAFPRILQKCKQPYILFLEEDFELRVPEEAIRPELEAAIRLLDLGASGVRFRNRHLMGVPNFAWGRNHSSALWLENVQYTNWTERTFPSAVWATGLYPMKQWCTAAKHADYTNNPVMYRREVAAHAFVMGLKSHEPRAGAAVESRIQRFWRGFHYVICHGNGLFTHRRLDRTLCWDNQTHGEPSRARPCGFFFPG